MGEAEAVPCRSFKHSIPYAIKVKSCILILLRLAINRHLYAVPKSMA